MDTKDNVKQYIQDRIDYAKDIVDEIKHRIEYGDPILMHISYIVGIENEFAKTSRKKLIQTRRKLLGLPYEEYKKL
ncbi:MAG: hypothetical protein QXH07_01250 [Thermoplasmata archaeon]